MSNDEEAIRDIQDQLDAATTKEEKLAILAGAAADCGPVDISQIQQMVSLADMAHRQTLMGIVDIARAKGVDSVPVHILEMLSKEPSVTGAMIWKGVDTLGINVDMGITVPDDLSELEGL